MKMSYICSEVISLEIKKKKSKYINIRATNELYNDLLSIAKKEESTITEIATYLIKLGLNEYNKK